MSLPFYLLLILIAITSCDRVSDDIGAESYGYGVESGAELEEKKPTVKERTTEEQTTEAPKESSLRLAEDGVQVTNTRSNETQVVSFDSDITLAIVAVSTVLGEPAVSAANSECDAGPMTFTTWGNGFVLNATQGQFAGWSIRTHAMSKRLTTVNNVGIGTSLAELKKAYSVQTASSSLGIEFNAGNQLFGLLSSDRPDAIVTGLWAGVFCNPL